jgi:hypothetical protein
MQQFLKSLSSVANTKIVSAKFLGKFFLAMNQDDGRA